MNPRGDPANDGQDLDVLVIGAGQAGLATGYHLKRRGLRFAILERRAQPTGSWPSYYSSLRLFSPASYSSLPALAFPGPPSHHPTRDEVVRYLCEYAARFELPVIARTHVQKVERDGRHFRVTDGCGRERRARAVVAASGSFENPYVPAIDGREEFRGRALHAAEYREPESFRGQRVVVVGGANTAVQIGCELANVARTTLATRRRIRYRPLKVLGRSAYFWLRATGLDSSRWLDGASTDVIDDGQRRTAVEAGAPDRKPMFRRFTPDGVEWSDGSRERVDSVIFATGYRPNLGFLSALPVLDRHWRVLHRLGVSLAVPGLYFMGLVNQTCYSSASLRGVGADAERIVDELARYCGVS
jgi:putative flavoprotein involved in K+ transport